MDDKDPKKAHDLVTFDPNEAEGEGQDQELRYGKDPVDALRECRDRFQQNEKSYHELRRLLVVTIYALALRILADAEARDRFFALEYFQKPWRRYVRTPRDLFREVFKYITNEGSKIASKYAINTLAFLRG